MSGPVSRNAVLDRLALAGVLQYGFWVVLALSALALLITFFLKDVPMTQQPAEMPGEAEVEKDPVL